MKFLRTILCCLLVGAVRAAMADDAEGWQLLPKAEVDSAGIFLDQIVVPTAAQAASSHIRLAQAPILGQVASLSRAQIAELARKSGGLAMTNWTGATYVRVSRRTRQFTDSELTEALTATLQREFVKNRGELEVHPARPWTPIPVPDEKLTLKIADMPAAGVSPNFVLTFELWNGRERVGSWELAAQAAIWRDVPVARSPLARGESLKNADVTLERRDILLQRDVLLNYPPTDDTLELAENVKPETPLSNHSVRVRPLILRGHVVDGVFQDGALSISLKVETLEDGRLGQTVRVLNPKTKRELYGKVQNDQTILISL